MFREYIEYSKNTLFINIEGLVNKNNINDLKRKLYNIISEYSISDIVIDISKTNDIDKEAFYDFLDDYDIKYGGNLVVMGNNK